MRCYLTAGQDGLTIQHAQQTVDFVTQKRIPSMFGRADMVAAGSLMSNGPSPVDQWQHGAVLVDKVLRGAKPADLPVEQPTKFELVINRASRES